VFIGRAQEKVKLFRTEKRRDQQGKSYPWIVPATGVMTSCFYCVDADFGPFCVEFCQSGHRGHSSGRRSPESPTVSQRIVWGITATAAGYEREPWDVHGARPVAKQCERMFGMGKLRAMHWLFAQASTGIKDLPRNGAWVLSRVVESPTSTAGSVSGSATDAARRISAAVADVLPGSHDSVEVRLKRAEAAVARAKQAEQEALAQARNADNLAEVAKAVTEEGRQRQREAAREGKQEIDRRAQEARRSLEHQVGQEREQASQEVTDRLEKLRAEVEAHTLQARQDADEAAKRAQEQIAQAHEQMTAARTLAAEATRAAQEAADQAHQQARAVAEQADLNAGSADRALADARGTEELLATETARAIQAEREYEVPERLDERTKAELLDIAHPLQISGVARMSKEQLVRSIQRASRAKARTSTATR
jgi:colicin import membrane protein